MLEHAELRGEEEGAGLPLAEKLVVEDGPIDAGGGVTEHDLLLQIKGDGAVDPHEDGAVHLYPCRPLGVGRVGEDVVGEGVLPEDDEEVLAPPIVVVGGTIQRDGDEHLDVDDGEGLGMHGGVLGLKGVKGSIAISLGLGGGLTLKALLLGLVLAALGVIIRRSHARRVDASVAREDGGAACESRSRVEALQLCGAAGCRARLEQRVAAWWVRGCGFAAVRRSGRSGDSADHELGQQITMRRGQEWLRNEDFFVCYFWTRWKKKKKKKELLCYMLFAVRCDAERGVRWR